MEAKTEVRPFRVSMKCDICETGEMTFTSNALMSNPVQYQHICNNIKCKNTASYLKQYPVIEYLDIQPTPPDAKV